MKRITNIISLAMVSLGVLGLIYFSPLFKQKLAKKTGLVVINVLDKTLYDDCHIQGSIHVAFDSIQDCVNLIDKSAEIVLYCSNYFCSSSDSAAQKLKSLGFEHVSVYHAGMAEWFQHGLPVQGSAQAAYLNHHVENPAAETYDLLIPVVTTEQLAIKLGYQIKNENQLAA